MINQHHVPMVELLNEKPKPSFSPEQIYEKMCSMFGEDVNPFVFPSIFKYRVSLARFELTLLNQETQSHQTE